MGIEGALDQTVTTRGNDRLNALGTQVREEGIGVVSLVGTERVRLQIIQQRQSLRAVAGLPAGETKPRQRSQTLNQGVDLGTQPAPASSEGLITLFLGAPAAC